MRTATVAASSALTNSAPESNAESPSAWRLGADFSLVANQYWNGDIEMQSAVGCCECDLVVGRDHRYAFGAQRLSATAKFGKAGYFLSGEYSSGGEHGLILARPGGELQ